MSQRLAETLLFGLVAVNAGLLVFIAGVLRKVMDDMDEPAFQQFVGSLFRHSSRSPFMLTILTLPFIGSIPYFYFWGCKNLWITSGLALWFVTGCIAKIIKVRVYTMAAASPDGVGLEGERRRLYFGNTLQAILNLAAAALMTVAFIK
jgi:hypothetical protein